MFKGVRTISSVGKRYLLLRQRIAELSSLVEAEIQLSESISQTSLLEKVDRLTLFGITYYFGTMISYLGAGFIFYKIMIKTWPLNIEKLHDADHEIELANHTGEFFKLFIFLPLFLLAWWIGKDVLSILSEEFRSARWLKHGRREKFASRFKGWLSAADDYFFWPAAGQEPQGGDHDQ